MSHLRRLRLLRVIGILAVFSLVLGACATAAPVAPATGDEAAAPAQDATDLPAEAGRGTDGTLNMLYWQAPSILNPYLSTGTKDFHAASLILEPLMWYDPDGQPYPALAAEVPTLENGGIAEDQLSITLPSRKGCSGRTARPSLRTMSSLPGSTAQTLKWPARRPTTLMASRASRPWTI